MLKILVEMYFEDGPKQLAAVGQAIARHDAKELERSAHTFKGSVGMFHAQPAFELALKLEKMGHAGQWDGVDEAFAALEKEAGRLKPALEALIR
jgi:HPt (histidine-containing phosphotransfer) domain-containing protein